MFLLFKGSSHRHWNGWGDVLPCWSLLLLTLSTLLISSQQRQQRHGEETWKWGKVGGSTLSSSTVLLKLHLRLQRFTALFPSSQHSVAAYSLRGFWKHRSPSTYSKSVNHLTSLLAFNGGRGFSLCGDGGTKTNSSQVWGLGEIMVKKGVPHPYSNQYYVSTAGK